MSRILSAVLKSHLCYLIAVIVIISQLQLVNCNEPKDYYQDEIINDSETAKKWARASVEFDSIVWRHRTDALDLLKRTFSSSTFDKSISSKCSKSLQTLNDGLKRRQHWAYQCKSLVEPLLTTFTVGHKLIQLLLTIDYPNPVVDASAHGQSGLAFGYIADLGHRDECLAIDVNDDHPFTGQYCLMNLEFPMVGKQRDKNWLRPLKLNLTEVGLQGTVYEHYGNHSEVFHHEHHTFAICLPSTCSMDEISMLINIRKK